MAPQNNSCQISTHRIYLNSSQSMKECSQTLCFELRCNCPQQEPLPSSQQQTNTHDDIYARFAQTLETQLRLQHEKYTAEIDEMSNQVFTLRNTVTRLELRNKKDNDTLQELRREYNILLQKIKGQEPRIIKEIEVIEKIKEVPVAANNEGLQQQVRRWRAKAEDWSVDYQKMRVQRDLANEKLSELKDEIERTKARIKKLQSEVSQLHKTVDEKDRNIDKLNNRIIFLKNNKEIVYETKHLFPDFKAPEKIRTETKVETIYIDRPVEKPVFVQVEKRVKEFVQPQRPVVNRIISCPQENPCNCQDEQLNVLRYKSEISGLQTYIDQLEGNLNSYKSERQKLVDVIGSKNSELNYLQAKMQLYGGTSPPARHNEKSTVSVVVSRNNEQKPVSQKMQPKPEKPPARK